MRLQKALQLIESQSRNVQAPDTRDVDGAVAIDSRVHIQIDLSPGANQQLIPRTDDVIRGDRGVVDRGKCRRRLLKQVHAVDRQRLSEGSGDHLLEIGQLDGSCLGLGSQRKLVLLPLLWCVLLLREAACASRPERRSGSKAARLPEFAKG